MVTYTAGGTPVDRTPFQITFDSQGGVTQQTVLIPTYLLTNPGINTVSSKSHLSQASYSSSSSFYSFMICILLVFINSSW